MTKDQATEGEVVKKGDITVSSLTTNLAFNEKVAAVDTALVDRTKAKKAIKTSWAKVVAILQDYDIDVPARRWEPVKALNEVNRVRVFLPQDERLNDKERVELARSINYEVDRILSSRKMVDYLEGQNPGTKKDLLELQSLYELSNQGKTEDAVKTKEGRAKLRAAIREYIDAIEAHDETVESVADVREYISVVKEVAEISAIAQGRTENV